MMKTSLLKIFLLSVTVGASGLLAQAGPGQGQRPNRPDGPTIPARILANIDNLPTETQDLINRFQAQRTEWLASRAALREKLAAMTTEEREAAIAAFRESQHTQIQAQRELARQLRDQLRELRKTRTTTGG